MALTPEDVVNKRFQPTKFREGYDQDEVDDFLDEVVVELRRLNQENDELRQRVISNDARINELQRTVNSTAASAADAARGSAPAGATSLQGESGGDPGSSNNLLQLARRLHEDHVREGVEKRDALIAEGKAIAARVVQDAQRGQFGNLDQERQHLERRVNELRTFEREYRLKLKGYIEGQLRELDASNVMTTGAQPAMNNYNGPPPGYPGQKAPVAPNYRGFAGAN
jgi:hypothetical protein